MGGFGRFGAFGATGMIVGWILTAAVLIGLVLLVVWAVRQIASRNAGAGYAAAQLSPAKEIAQQRYAKGEIDREQYQQILADLSR
jgi:putative membrane protein